MCFGGAPPQPKVVLVCFFNDFKIFDAFKFSNKQAPIIFASHVEVSRGKCCTKHMVQNEMLLETH